jgi:hypothetical protein
VNRHASPDELARLGADDLKPHKAARIRQHLATCSQCTQLNSQLSAVPAVLASLEFGPIPENLSARIESALVVEARLRLANEPATEVGRRDLPTARSARLSRQRHGRDGAGWRLPGLSVAATRALATAGAIALIGGGGYEIASHAGAPTASTASSSSGAANAAVPGATASQSIGAPVNYGHGSEARSIETVTSPTDFEPSTLGPQATAALKAARAEGVHSGPPVSNGPLSANKATANSTSGLRNTTGTTGLVGAKLAGCIGRFSPGRVVQLVENAKFNGKPATIIITSLPSGQSAEVWVVGESCSASHGDVLDHLKVARI